MIKTRILLTTDVNVKSFTLVHVFAKFLVTLDNMETKFISTEVLFNEDEEDEDNNLF